MATPELFIEKGGYLNHTRDGIQIIDACAFKKKGQKMKNTSRLVSEPIVEIITPGGYWVDTYEWMVSRMRVPGGWLVTNAVRVHGDNAAFSLATEFVSDPSGSWEIAGHAEAQTGGMQ